MNRLALILPGLALLAVISGCVYTVAQTPEAVSPGNIVAGIVAGATAGNNRVGESAWNRNVPYGAEVGLYGRAGLAKNLDAGLRLSVPNGLLADLKYQFSRRTPLVAASLGLSYAPFVTLSFLDNPETMGGLGLYPALLVGSKRAYCGLRGIVQAKFQDNYGHSELYAGPQILGGLTLGRGKLRALPEASLWWLPVAPSPAFGVGLGIAIQYQMKGTFRDIQNQLPKGLIPNIR